MSLFLALRPLVLALGLAACLSAAAQAPAPTLRPEIAKPLQAAQAALQAKQPQEALAKLRDAEAVAGRTPYETYVLLRLQGAAALSADDDAAALAAFTQVVDSEHLPAAERLDVLQTLAGLAQRQKDTAATERWARRYFAEGGQDEGVRTLLIHALYAGKQWAPMQKELDIAIAADDAAGRPVTEAKLQMRAIGYQSLQDGPALQRALERLVAVYPKPERWATLLDQLRRQPGFAPRLTLETLRLARQTGALLEAADWVDLAQMLQEAGQPGEAAAVVEQGFQKGLLGQGADAAAHTQLRQKLAKLAAADRASLAASQASAQKAKDGAAAIAVGQALVADGQGAAGLALMAQGIEKGVGKQPEDAKLRYGANLLQQGQREPGLAMLKTVQGADGATDLARLWPLAVR